FFFANVVLSLTATNTTSKVTWDKYSLLINGERKFIFSGEFHYFRLPSPDLWRDIFQKMKALGFNTVSLYFSWAYHSSMQDDYDFEGIRDIEQCLRMAQEVGLYVIARPGPYINAEVDNGGFPGWLVNMKSKARQNNEEYEANWKEYFSAINPYIEKQQIDQGGPIILYQIENEYTYNVDANYMQALEEKVRADGIVVPTIFNDAATLRNFANGKGSVNIYGFDSYPVGFDCSNPDSWPLKTPKIFRLFHQVTNPSEPLAIYEFQGGAFDPWSTICSGGPGYGSCRQLVNERFAKVFYKNNYAHGATIHNLYMAYGGTTWGDMAEPTVYTSYDYGASISEPRMMTAKAYEVKLQATFISTVKPFTSTDHCTSLSTNLAILVDSLQDPNTKTQFYIAQHLIASSLSVSNFNIFISTEDGRYSIPAKKGTYLTLDGRDAKIITAYYDFGSQHLVYSTSEIFTHIVQDSRDVLLVYAYEGHAGEIALKYPSGSANLTCSSSDVSSDYNNNVLQVNYHHPDGTNPICVSSPGKDLLILVAGYESATKWWAPEIAPDERVLISGPYLVRNASVKGSTLSFYGDIDQDTSLEIVASESIKAITWNDQALQLRSTSYGTWTSFIPGPSADITLPDLSKLGWKFSNASPETQLSFDDSKWMDANHTITNSPYKPTTYPVLYGDEYGYHYGSLWFRGTFDATDSVTNIMITASTGTGGAWIAWLNGEYLGGETTATGTFAIDKALLNADGKNVLALLAWTTGHEEDGAADDTYKQPRGFTDVSLIGLKPDGIQWKVQGCNLNGEDIVDKVRGPYNEGGLYGERMGWHLPGYPDSQWNSVSVPDDRNRTGLSWYRTTFNLDIPENYDVPIGVRFEDNISKRYRAVLFVNGWKLGKYANDLGPQRLFYIPEGILNHNGLNTLSIGVVPLDNSTSIGKVSLEAYGTLLSSKGATTLVNSPNYDPATRF
ncbi:hypothetical protein INT44_006216, partial [Umbelopsis vinacea]